MSIITKLAEEAANQVVAATSGKKKKKRGSPAWLLAPAGLGAAAGLGGAYALGSDQHAKDIEQAIGQHGTALEPNETYLSRYANMLSPGANTKIMGKPIGDLLALGRSSPTVLKAFGADPTYAASNPGSWHDAKAHYSMFAQGPIAAYAHMMHPNKMMNRAEYNVDIGDGKKAPYTEVMNKKFQEHWNKFRDPNSGYAGLKGNASWLEPHDVSTDMVPYADQVKFLKDFHAGLPPELRKIKEQVENDPTEKKMPDGTVWKGTKPALEQNLSNYVPITRGALKARNIMKNVGITSAGAGVGGLLGHYLHGALADEENPSTLGYLASTLGGAGLGGAASYFGGTEQGRKTMSDAAAKLMSLMQKKSAAAKMCDCCKKAPCQCPPNCSCGCKAKMAAAKPGLWANIHAKKERGAAPAKPGDKNYPDAKNWKKVTEESEKKAYGEPNLGLPADMIPQTSIRKGNQQYSGPANTAPAWTNSAQKELDQKIKAHQERVDRILKRKPSAPTQPAATTAATTQPQIQSQSFTSPAASEFLRTTKSPAAMPKPVVQPKKIQSESWTSPDAAEFLTKKKASVKKATEQSEKKAGLFYKNLDRPVFVGLEDEKGALGLAAMRTQEPRALTRLFDNSDLDVDKAIKHMNDNNWANDNKHSTFHPADQLNLALKKLFPSRYRTPNLNDAATFIASDLNQQPEPKTKNEFNKLIQSKYKHLLHTPYLSTEDSTDLKNFINALGESFPEKQNKTVKKASPAWQTSEGKSESGGLNDKGRASLKAQGHDIKRPQPEGGPRKDSFCARMKGMKSKLTSDETANDPDSRINKALRKWKCGSAQEKWAALATLALSSNAPTLGSVVQGPKAEKGHGIKFQFGTASNPSFLR